MAVVTILTGVGAGCGGMLLALLPHASQHVAYGYSLAHGVGSESFLTGVTQADPLRRLAVLVVRGRRLVGAVPVRRPLVSIRRAIRAADPRVPFVNTIVHALLQIVTVALGSRSRNPTCT